MKKYLVIAAIVVLLLFYSEVSAEPTIWYVHPDSSLNTIQAGLDSCADNDIVLVGPGTYLENISWPSTQGIHLLSELGPEVTIIDGDSAGSAISIMVYTDTTTIIRGFTIQNGFAAEGAGIDCMSGPTIMENIITDNVALNLGGGVHSHGAYSPVIINNIIRKNKVTEIDGWGGGIIIYGSSPFISGNTIAENTADWGAGMAFYICSIQSVITDNLITNNICTRSGGGIYVSFSQCNFDSNTITLNEANYGAGIHVVSCAPAVYGNTISGNTAANYGGGIYAYANASPAIRGNVISSNISNTGGGGIACYNSSPTIDSCKIFDNDICGIYCLVNSNPTINYNEIVGNACYGVQNLDAPGNMINAENNWWGDSTGPYHPDSNPEGLGDTVSDYVDFIPWLYQPGVEEQPFIKPMEKCTTFGATIFAGPLILPKDINCRVFDITGRVVAPQHIKPGVYFIKVNGEIRQKVVKIR